MTYTEISKFLSFVLRHQPEAIGLTLDREGWVSIDDLIAGASKDGKELSYELIEAVVDGSDKKRFAISEDGALIRAVQGHSTETVQRSFPEQIPPETLYHGTATRFLESIREQGLLAGSRHYVHLSHNQDTAIAVGRRYGKPVLLEIDALEMQQQGFKFFLSENGVWLTQSVPREFIRDERS
ncbi:RNA 2'-phosphotransferase [Aquirhabdus parva]|uniref:Probable RNA 2'-phosphotransferase n=1 Tax=Aquirhabdus parva TaxID=2283318 RepID=A0A345P8J4_9GAMM|nr:RNA 2'-phosphotransferase [Aquirhabdus parva]AXI03603.1 RNA 2'-phosphotransferase [Aquirhabdus parva]